MFEELIPIIFISLILLYSFSKANKKFKDKNSEYEMDENFPFPEQYFDDRHESVNHNSHEIAEDYFETIEYQKMGDMPFSYESIESSEDMYAKSSLIPSIGDFEKEENDIAKSSLEDSIVSILETNKQDILKNFNLREAVIYSELLNAKYKDM